MFCQSFGLVCFIAKVERRRSAARLGSALADLIDKPVRGWRSPV